MADSKSFNNSFISNLLRNVAASYQYKDANKYKFQIIAYDRAATAIEHATSELKDLWDDGKLDEIPGIGPSLAGHIDDLFKTGKSKHFEEVMSGIPETAFELMKLPKIGIKTAMKLLNESSKVEINKLLEDVKKLEKTSQRHLLPYAQEVVDEVVAWMKQNKHTLKIDPLGSLRRRVATVGDIDISIASDNPTATMDHFVSYPKKQNIIEKGPQTASILLPNNVQVDVLVIDLDSYGAALQHFTGSKQHNIALREYSLKKNLSLNEKGIRNTKTNKLNKFKTEEEFYKFLNLSWIPPEMREGTGEIKAALEGKLPKLVELGNVKADLQIHSDFNIETSHDLGQSSMSEIVGKANSLNYEYLAFTEHNPSKSMHTEKQIVDLLLKKQEYVQKLNDKLNYSGEKPRERRVTRVFNSLEIDIGKDGSLPVPERGMETLDFALVSVHTVFDLPKKKMTERVLRALSHPKVKIFAHPTARKIQEREGIDLDWPKIFEFCKTNGKWIEINADPMRLDLPDTLVRDAVKLGVKLTLGTDSHHADMLLNMRYGLDVARRGWCQSSDIINTLTLKEFEKELKRGD